MESISKKTTFPLLFILFLVVSLLILGPMLMPGYLPLFVLDVGPMYQPEGSLNFLNVLNLSRIGLNTLIPDWLSIKLILVSILSMAALNMSLLIPGEKNSIKILGGLFYVLNPFVQTRLFAGHIHLLASYALMPLGVYVLSKTKEKKDIIWVMLVSFAILNISLHVGYIFYALGGLWVVVDIIKKNFKKAIYCCTGLSLALIGNLILLSGLVADITGNFGPNEVTLYQTVKDPIYGWILNVLGLYGFYLEPIMSTEGFTFTKDILWMWPLFTILFLYLSLLGWKKGMKGSPTMSISIGVIAVIGVVISLGIGNQVTKPIFTWLWEYLPMFKGFREPQKWLLMLALFIAYFGAIGLSHFLESKKKYMIKITLAIIVIFTFNFSIFWGSLNAIQTFWFPKSWYEAREMLMKEWEKCSSSKCKSQQAIFLPWSLFQSFSFTKNRTMPNPGKEFFAPIEVIEGDNIEYFKPFTPTTNPNFMAIESFLVAPTTEKLQVLHQQHNITWIIAVGDIGNHKAFSYGFLDTLKGMEPIYSTPKIKIFRIQTSSKKEE